MRLSKPGLITGQDVRTECVPFCIIDCVFRLQKPIGGWFYPLAKYVYCILCIVALVAGAALGGIG